MWEAKNIQDFCPRDIESCHLVAPRRVKLWSLKVAQNSFLFFWSLLELDAIFQTWNCTVLNACAIYLR